jgi:hypothetical protein
VSHDTKVRKANNENYTLEVTIPAFLADKLGLEDGDIVHWEEEIVAGVHTLRMSLVDKRLGVSV